MRTKKEIDHCIKTIQDLLADSKMDLENNAHLKEGYIKALEILKKRIDKVADAKMDRLNNEDSRAIAVLAIYFLNGECTENMLAYMPHLKSIMKCMDGISRIKEKDKLHLNNPQRQILTLSILVDELLKDNVDGKNDPIIGFYYHLGISVNRLIKYQELNKTQQ